MPRDAGIKAETGGRQSRWLSRAWLAWLLGALISLTVFLLLNRQEGRRDEAEFRRQVATYLGALQEHRNGCEDLLRTLRALFYQNPHLGRQLFTNTVQDLAIRMEGMQAIGWAPRVTDQNRARFEEAVQRDGLPGFQILEGDLAGAKTGVTRAGERAEYFPLLFSEPMAGNELPLGYDLACQSAIQNLLARTHLEGGAEVSGPIPLPYKGALKTGVLAAMPVYSPEFVPPTREERIRQNQGYVVAVFIIDELMKAITARTPDLRLDVMLFDASRPDPKAAAMGFTQHGKVVSKVNPSDIELFRSRPGYSQVITIGGRRLGFEFRRGDNWNRGPNRWIPAGALCIGLLLTSIVSQAVRSSSEKARQVEVMVHVRTAELARANAQLQAEVGERIQAQNQLAHEHNLLYVLLNRLPDPVHVTDCQGNYVLANDAHARLLNQPDSGALVGKPVRQVGPKPLAETLAAGSEDVLRSGTAIIGQETTVAVGDPPLSLEVTKLPMRDREGKADGILVISRDVTQIRQKEAEQRELARRLQETQKLESLGIIAGGIAHDFNNLLTIILGNANIARLNLPPDSNLVECLGRIEATSLRAADLCKQMLAYSGKGLFVIRRLDLSNLVHDMAELLQLSISKKVTLQFQLGASLPPVLADATQLQQILMNLVSNASEAIGEREGTVWIRSGLVEIDREAVRSFSPPTDIAEGEYVFLEVADDGCGMTPQIRERIFDPFFSTKFTGRGLGLAAVLGIVRSHRGAITVQSQVGRGSSFRLLLPPAEGGVEEDVSLTAPSTSWRGQGTILLAEDEAGVRITTADLLRAGGFSVDVAENGRTAIDRFRLAPNRYRAVLLDFTMPEGDGEEAFLEIRQIRPHAPVLIMSGYSPQHVLDRFVGKGLNGFIQKPFQARDLMNALRKALETESTDGRG